MSPDPYVILGLDPSADDAAIRAAFHALVRAGRADATVNGAYAAIRDGASRERRRWSEPTAMLAPLPSATAAATPAVAVEALAAELAFLSDWELGDVHGR
jgi:hypothetical protein